MAEFSERAAKVTANCRRVYLALEAIDKVDVSTDPRELGITPEDRRNMTDWFKHYLERAGVILGEEIN